MSDARIRLHVVIRPSSDELGGSGYRSLLMQGTVGQNLRELIIRQLTHSFDDEELAAVAAAPFRIGRSTETGMFTQYSAAIIMRASDDGICIHVVPEEEVQNDPE